MIFLASLPRGASFAPAVVHRTEALLESKPGSEKQRAAISFAGEALGVTSAPANRRIVDEGKCNGGLSKAIDGVANCMKASVWAKAK
jgi:hypothetical protein